MSVRLFHLAPPDALARALAEDGAWSPPSIAREGFVHLSFAHQLAGTLAAHFADAAEILLVEVDAGAVADALRLEVSRGGERFPHLYRPLASGDLLRTWHLARGTDPGGSPARTGGGLVPPRLGSRAAEDRPPGGPVPPDAAPPA